jgi:hypothetical protein
MAMMPKEKKIYDNNYMKSIPVKIESRMKERSAMVQE